MRRSSAPASSRGQDELLFAQRQHLAAQLARQPCPADQREDDRDGEIDAFWGPVLRQGCAQRHPQRDSREGANHLDHALHDVVDAAAVVAGSNPQDRPDDQAQEHADEADGQRHLAADDDARELIAPLAVGAEQVDRLLRVFRAEQVEIHGDQAEELVFVAVNEEPDRDFPIRIGLVGCQQRIQVDFPVERVHVEANVPIDVQGHRLRIQQLDPAAVDVIGRDEVGEDHHHIKANDGHATDGRGAGALELAPHQLPLREAIALFVRGARDLLAFDVACQELLADGVRSRRVRARRSLTPVP